MVLKPGPHRNPKQSRGMRSGFASRVALIKIVTFHPINLFQREKEGSKDKDSGHPAASPRQYMKR